MPTQLFRRINLAWRFAVVTSPPYFASSSFILPNPYSTTTCIIHEERRRRYERRKSVHTLFERWAGSRAEGIYSLGSFFVFSLTLNLGDTRQRHSSLFKQCVWKKKEKEKNGVLRSFLEEAATPRERNKIEYTLFERAATEMRCALIWQALGQSLF